ncbi:hypothetical protein EYC84_007811 [Monilinia fructicola]|uniref:Uncharacterized protein n=1 Tax=Monilinia fructicola TaxID=38448 RepID=A0A5M9JJJ9_MONFR|nr:hypothetical protein EYC84_007811 [Monilinia fructicola]
MSTGITWGGKVLPNRYGILNQWQLIIINDLGNFLSHRRKKKKKEEASVYGQGKQKNSSISPSATRFGDRQNLKKGEREKKEKEKEKEKERKKGKKEKRRK